jgi:hypothetical protein
MSPDPVLPSQERDDTDLYYPYTNSITPDTHSDLSINKYGLRNVFGSITAHVINFYLPDDSALKWWDRNQSLNKPHSAMLNAGDPDYVYSASGNYQGDHLYCVRLGQNDRRVVDMSEAMAYVTQSRSYAAGRIGNTAGSVSDGVGLPSLCDYGEEAKEHSAEWVWSIQRMYPCFKELLRRFQLQTITN